LVSRWFAACLACGLPAGLRFLYYRGLLPYMYAAWFGLTDSSVAVLRFCRLRGSYALPYGFARTRARCLETL